MPKVVQDIELLKKLQEYITFETEYVIEELTNEVGEYKYVVDEIDEFGQNGYHKTLTTDEAIELLQKYYAGYYIIYGVKNGAGTRFFDIELSYEYLDNGITKLEKITKEGETILQAVEKMLEYLIDNNLLGEK